MLKDWTLDDIKEFAEIYKAVDDVRKINDVGPGDIVKSTYKAPWVGVLVRFDKNDKAQVLQLIDRHGNMLRKPKLVTLDPYWLKLS